MWWRLILRLVLAVLGLFCCYRLIVGSAKVGYSRLLSTTSIVQSGIESGRAAVSLTPNDPEAHYTLALALVNHEQLPEAVGELREATRLRPHHYYEWLDLGLTLDRLDDQESALAALKESVRLAPSFAQPRWQIGSFYYRQGRYQEAFADLRLGAKSNPNFSEALVDLAWLAADGDVPMIERLLDPQDTTGHLLLADFLAGRGKGADAVRHVRAAGQPRADLDRALIRETIKALIATNYFSLAYDVWAPMHIPGAQNGAQSATRVVNADFMDPIAQYDPGFNWQLSALPNVSVSVDRSGPAKGTQSILFNFNGESAAGSPMLSQIVLVKPKTHYLLNFMTKTENLITGGPLIIKVTDSSNAKALGQSKPLPTGTTDWIQGQVEFSTDEKAEAMTMTLQRLNCSQSPCPIFGKSWLGKFTLTTEAGL